MKHVSVEYPVILTRVMLNRLRQLISMLSLSTVMDIAATVTRLRVYRYW